MSTVSLLRRTLISMISAFTLAALAVSPALADQELGHTGTVGYHALRDGADKGGAICRYKGIYPSPGGYSYEGKLKWIDVRPPKVRSIAGVQKVGWRFMVERQTDFSGPWILRYTSPIQTDMTNASTNAGFAMMGINVTVPTSGADDSPYYSYRVKVKMFWYTGGGAVQGTATHLVEVYKQVYNNWPIGDGTETYTDKYPCDGWQGFEIN